MQLEPPIAGAPASSTRFFTDAHWWLFCLLILVLNFLLLAFDPLPKLFMGDSESYCGRHGPGGCLLTGHSYTGM
jgi:hypothetical protein